MRKFLLLLSLAFSFSWCKAQTPGWLWAEPSGGSNYQYGDGAAVDDSGFFYMGGRFAPSITFGTHTISTSAPATQFFGKFDASGNCLWLAQQFYSYGYDYPRGFCIDRAQKNNVYATGLISSGSGMYVVKFNNMGALQWSTTLGSGGGYTTAPNADGIAADTSGNVYVTGQTGGGSGTNWTFGDSVLNYPGTNSSQEMFLTKLDKNGHFLWAVGASDVNGASSYDVGRSVTVDKSGQFVFVSGGYYGTPLFHSRNPAGDITAPAQSGPNSTLFLAKYDSAGNLIFVTTAPGAGIPWTGSTFTSSVGASNSIALDLCDNVFIAGTYSGSVSFGPFSLTASGGSDGFVACCNNLGQWQWVDDVGGGGNNNAGSVVLDKNNDVYVGGGFTGTANFGYGTTVTCTSGGQAYIAKFNNSTGAVQWVLAPTGSGTSGNGGVAVDTSKFVYFTGSFAGTISLGLNNLTYTGSYGQGIFVAKLDTVPPRYIIPVIDSSYCPGSSSVIPFSIVGTFNNGNVFTAELSDSTGSFVTNKIIGTDTSTNGGNLNITIPANVTPGSSYLIRVISSNPATSSYVNGCGAYYQPNVYINNFYVTIGGNLNFTVSNDTTVCPGSPIQLTANGATSYSWQPATGLSCTGCSNPIITSATASTTYTVTASSSGCTGSKQVTVQIANAASAGIITIPRDTICQGTTGLLTLVGSSGQTLQWQSSTDGSTFTNIKGATDTIKYRTVPLNANTFYRVLDTSGSCTAISDTLKVIVPPPLTALFSFTTQGTTVMFNSSDSKGNVVSYYWDFGDGQNSNQANPTHTFAKDTVQYVCLTIYDGSNCSYTLCKDVSFEGVALLDADDDFMIYPNPFNSELIINGKNQNNPIQGVEVYDMLGRLMLDNRTGNSFTNPVELNTQQLAKGMYYLKIQTAEASYVQKIVKQ